MSQLDCVGSGSKVQRQKMGLWSLGERKTKVMHLRGGRGRKKSFRHVLERMRWAKKGESAGILQRGRACTGSFASKFLCVFQRQGF